MLKSTNQRTNERTNERTNVVSVCVSEQICGFQCLHRDMPDVCVCTDMPRVSVYAQNCGCPCLHRSKSFIFCTEVWVSLFSQRWGCLYFHRDVGFCVLYASSRDMPHVRASVEDVVKQRCQKCYEGRELTPSLIPAACQHWQQQCLGRLTNQRTVCNAYVGPGGMNNGLKRLKRKVDINFPEITSS